MEEKISAETKKSPVASIATLVVFLFIGAGIGFLMKSCPAANCDLELGKDLAEDAVPATDTEISEEQAATEQTSIGYKTFSLPDAYFTFEYPESWIYEKVVSAPGEYYSETSYTFFTDASKKTETFVMHYPMYETAMDTCMKFEEVSDYMHQHIATNDPGTFINYITCGSTEYDSGDIFWQKGVWDGDKMITSDEKTQVRILWRGTAVAEEIMDYVAHSIKIIK
jgi:hypothetical protein